MKKVLEYLKGVSQNATWDGIKYMTVAVLGSAGLSLIAYMKAHPLLGTVAASISAGVLLTLLARRMKARILKVVGPISRASAFSLLVGGLCLVCGLVLIFNQSAPSVARQSAQLAPSPTVSKCGKCAICRSHEAYVLDRTTEAIRRATAAMKDQKSFETRLRAETILMTFFADELPPILNTFFSSDVCDDYKAALARCKRVDEKSGSICAPAQAWVAGTMLARLKKIDDKQRCDYYLRAQAIKDMADLESPPNPSSTGSTPPPHPARTDSDRGG